METVRQRHELDLLAYVIMPEHVHQLVFPRNPVYRMDRILSDLKRPVSWKAKRHLMERGMGDWLARLSAVEGSQTTFRFWLPGGGFDANITCERSIAEIGSYMHLNPVRRGLVDDPLEWEWSSARYWEGLRPVPIEMDPIPR
jgi:putative transposase